MTSSESRCVRAGERRALALHACVAWRIQHVCWRAAGAAVRLRGAMCVCVCRRAWRCCTLVWLHARAPPGRGGDVGVRTVYYVQYTDSTVPPLKK